MSQPQMVICLKGSAASGKTSLAHYIKDTFPLFRSKNVVIFDDVQGSLEGEDREKAKAADIVIICRAVDWRL